MSENDLFRPEALMGARARFGAPVNNFGLKSWVIPVFMAVVFAVTLGFLNTARYAKTETVLGEIVPAGGVAKIAPVRVGMIKKVWIKSGEIVASGQPLFSLSYDSVLENGDTLSDRLNDNSELQAVSSKEQNASKRLQIVQSQLETDAVLSGLDSDVARYMEQKGIQSNRVNLLEQTVASFKVLAEKQYVSELTLRQSEDQLLQARQNLSQIEQNISQAQSQIKQRSAQKIALKQSLSESDAAARFGQAQLEERRLANVSTEGGQIIASKDGKITSLQSKEGDIVSPGQTLGLIVPSSDKAAQQVVLWVPSRSLGFVQVGTKVRLMFDAFPYQTFGVGAGKVVEISNAPLNPNELPVPIDTKEQMYKITVALNADRLTAYGRSWALIPGMRLSADLILDEKSFLDWLLDPLHAAAQRAVA